jgi:hypothetical protein
VPADKTPVPFDASPADRIAAAVKIYGERETVDRAAALLGGANAGEDFLLFVGGTHAKGILDGAPALYWPELWGARALMYVWHDSAAIAIKSGLTNQAWRVREMSLKVVAARELAFTEQVLPMLTDEVGRVRAVLWAKSVTTSTAPPSSFCSRTPTLRFVAPPARPCRQSKSVSVARSSSPRWMRVALSRGRWGRAARGGRGC